ncbi:hypothetical protein G6O67_006293 [Ophiocordyceps sinensis]|uniref:Uncharacterized protein n=1 Tax=Ophiocordyceps sinensis TaxID=72228 RepID=A0A8H4LW44_9HYPO|nr:hypothetical protein G6O67_006293 [Ophiocordyceps sinensis]
MRRRPAVLLNMALRRRMSCCDVVPLAAADKDDGGSQTGLLDGPKTVEPAPVEHVGEAVEGEPGPEASEQVEDVVSVLALLPVDVEVRVHDGVEHGHEAADSRPHDAAQDPLAAQVAHEVEIAARGACCRAEPHDGARASCVNVPHELHLPALLGAVVLVDADLVDKQRQLDGVVGRQMAQCQLERTVDGQTPRVARRLDRDRSLAPRRVAPDIGQGVVESAGVDADLDQLDAQRAVGAGDARGLGRQELDQAEESAGRIERTVVVVWESGGKERHDDVV